MFAGEVFFRNTTLSLGALGDLYCVRGWKCPYEISEKDLDRLPGNWCIVCALQLESNGWMLV